VQRLGRLLPQARRQLHQRGRRKLRQDHA
jgi:hypothetical protein